MKNAFLAELKAATELTRMGRVVEATATIQRLLRGDDAGAAADTSDQFDGVTLDGVARTVEAELPSQSVRSETVSKTSREMWGRGFASWFPWSDKLRATPTADRTEGAQFSSATFDNEVGSRPYKLYVPSGYDARPTPLIVMLHGCKQSPADFAAGTRMNEVGESETCFVAYPEQTRSANASKCWNWFSSSDQQRGGGEPAIIAGITREIMRKYSIDPRRVYVAGLSAGGAAAAVMGECYPDLYAAIGVHSGLACGAASDVPSAFAAMANGRKAPLKRTGSRGRRVVPTIVFHGDRDTTVHPRNGDDVIAQLSGEPLVRRVSEGRVSGGRAYRRTVYVSAKGEAVLEQWLIQGGGHAWAGGSSAGSYTDPLGPDATREMFRFFMEHAHAAQ